MSTPREEEVFEVIVLAAGAAAASLQLGEELVAGEPRVSDGEWLVTEQGARVLVAELSGVDSELCVVKVGAALLGLITENVDETLTAMLTSAADSLGATVDSVTLDAEFEPAPGDGVSAIQTASGMAVAEVRVRLAEPLVSAEDQQDNDGDADADFVEGTVADELTVEDVLAASPTGFVEEPQFVPEFATATAAATSMAPDMVAASVGAPVGPPRTINSAGSGSPLMHVSRLDQLAHVEMEVTVEIGRTRMTVGELLSLTPGQVIELDRAAGTPADLFVNGTLLARGEVVVVDEDFGLRVSEIVSSTEG